MDTVRKNKTDHIINVIIRENTVMVRSCAAERWMTTSQSVLNTQTEGSRPRGRPKLRWMERLKDDMEKNKIRQGRESRFEILENVNPTQETTER